MTFIVPLLVEREVFPNFCKYLLHSDYVTPDLDPGSALRQILANRFFGSPHILFRNTITNMMQLILMHSMNIFLVSQFEKTKLDLKPRRRSLLFIKDSKKFH
jgi:hypothetical protein